MTAIRARPPILAPTPMPAFAPMLRPEAGVGEDVSFGTEATVTGDETKVGETEETLVDVVGTNEDELEDDDTFNAIVNPRLCRVPLMKPLPVPVCPLGSWISRTKSGCAVICSSLMLSLSPIV